jgi:hypothetical protein
MTNRRPTPQGSFMYISTDIVDAEIPHLICLDTPEKFELKVPSDQNALELVPVGWRLPLTRKLGHIYLNPSPDHSILFTKTEMHKLHRSFFHPSSEKLLSLLKRARPDQVQAETRKLLNEIVDACTACQTFAPKPLSFRVSIPEEDLVLNDELSMDLMWFDGAAALHVIDTATRFSSATFLETQSVDVVWHAFIMCWVTRYVGYRKKFGPFSVLEVVGKKVTNRNSKGKLQEVSLHHKKPILTPSTSTIDSHSNDKSIIHTMLTNCFEEHKLSVPDFGV